MGIVRDRTPVGGERRPAVLGVAMHCRAKFDGKPGWELQNMLTIARLMIAGAAARDESRVRTSAAISPRATMPGGACDMSRVSRLLRLA